MKIGVVLPIAEDWESRTIPGYAEIRAYARQAEELGLDSVWLFDHLLMYSYPEQTTAGIWECWTILAALVEATERVELGTLVLCSPFRNPALVAKMAATLEEVSGGRLILGLGAGWHQPEFDAFGYPFDHLASRFEEALQIIVPLLREGTVDFRGRYSSAANCELRPRGPRAGGPPILVAGHRPRMLRLTAEHADAWNTAWLGNADLLGERRAHLEAACREVDRDPQTLEVTVGLTVNYEEGEETPDPTKILAGSPEEIAAGLRQHAAAGVRHAICRVSPRTPEALARFGEAVTVFREMTG